MFLEKIDWEDPRFSRWNLKNLGPLNAAQLDAFFLDDDIDFPEFNETELKELCLKFPCRVELFHSNVCNGVERSWPQRIFRRSGFKELLPHQKRILNRTMERDAWKLYKKYVDENRLKKRIRKRKNNTLAPYFEERYLRNQFKRIQALGDHEHDEMSDSDCSVATVINTMDNTPTSSEATDANNPNSNLHTNFNEHSPRDAIESCLSFMDKFDSRSIAQSKSTSTRSQRTIQTRSSTGIVTLATYSKDITLTEESNSEISNDLISEDPDVVDLFNHHQNFEGTAILLEDITVIHTSSIEQVDLTNGSFSIDDDDDDDDGRLVIDERFNDLGSECTVSTYAGDSCNDELDEIARCSTPCINSSEILPIDTIHIRRLRSRFYHANVQ